MRIHDAARNGDIAAVAAELTAGIAVDVPEYSAGLGYPSGPTALDAACVMPNADSNMVLFLITQGAVISPAVFKAAVQSGNFDTLRTLLRFGADVNAREEGGCGALTTAVYAHSVPEDSPLLALLAFLFEQGADPDVVSSYSESALSVASNNGRFDAVQFLLDHGANPTPLGWTDLMRSVALGTVEEVAALVRQGASLQDRDAWERTPFLLSLLDADLRKAQLLLAAGADRTDVGRCGKPPLHYAAERNRLAMLQWLLSAGFDAEATDEFGTTALGVAVEYGSAECVACLLDAGAKPGTAVMSAHRTIEVAPNLTIARLLIAAGEDLSQVNAEVRRELLKTTGDDPRVTREQYLAGRDRTFGRANPERADNPFRRAMVKAGCNAYRARDLFDDTGRYERPVWCYDRFGQTTTWLPDGRIIEIAGEHEDHYDPDFCIYNDVVVFDGKGGFEMLNYPESVFPPTDFHTATLVNDSLYIIGCLGYPKQRKARETPVYRLDCRTFRIEPVPTHGAKPGWISSHKAWYEADAHRICVSGGQIVSKNMVSNTRTYALNLKNHQWSRLSGLNEIVM